jgi:lipoprotein-anchoring transpeptidase ErfK/SrfK
VRKRGTFFAVSFILFAALIQGCSHAVTARNTAPEISLPPAGPRPYSVSEERINASEKIAGFEDLTTKTPLQTENSIIPFENYAPTVNMSIEELIGDNGDYAAPGGLPKPDTYRIIIDIANQVVMVFRKGIGGEYTEPVRYMLCSSGKNNKTPIGIFKLGKHHVRFGRFSIGGCAQYWSQITRRIYFHSVLYNSKNAQSYIKSAYNHLGTPVSHGCVRLTVPDARWIYYNIAPGTEVEIRKGSKEDVLTSSVREQLTLAKMPDEKVELEKGNIPNTDNWKVEEVPHEVDFEHGKA